MFGGILLFDEEFIHVVSITFTSLILTELLMVALTIRTWHWLMVAAEVFSLSVYIATLAVFKDYFGEFKMFNYDTVASFSRAFPVDHDSLAMCYYDNGYS